MLREHSAGDAEHIGKYPIQEPSPDASIPSSKPVNSQQTLTTSLARLAAASTKTIVSRVAPSSSSSPSSPSSPQQHPANAATAAAAAAGVAEVHYTGENPDSSPSGAEEGRESGSSLGVGVDRVAHAERGRESSQHISRSLSSSSGSAAATQPGAALPSSLIAAKAGKPVVVSTGMTPAHWVGTRTITTQLSPVVVPSNEEHFADDSVDRVPVLSESPTDRDVPVSGLRSPDGSPKLIDFSSVVFRDSHF